jgi:protoporphyrinogen oxidase
VALHRAGKGRAIVVEQQAQVGGNAGSFVLDGVPVDYGSHRLHPACQPEILADLQALLGGDLLLRRRHGRIHLQGHWLHFPLQPVDLLRRVPPAFALGVARDALGKLVPSRATGRPETFASTLEHHLGATICRDFYFPYARKIWGVTPDELSAVQARRRVSASSLAKMARKAVAMVPGFRTPGAGCFFYPRGGYGQITRAMAESAQQLGADLRLRTTIRRIRLGTPHAIEVEHDGARHWIEAEHVWSTVPLTVLARTIDPPPPRAVLDSAAAIRYRAMILIYLVVGQPRFTPFDAHYFPDPAIPLTRLSEPKNYSGRREPADRTVLCGELPCTAGDALWNAPDAELAGLVRAALARCGLPLQAPVLAVASRRLAHAYPIYRRGYEEHFHRLDEWLAGLDGILTFGRQGLFAHDNTHHTLAMAYAAVDSSTRAAPSTGRAGAAIVPSSSRTWWRTDRYAPAARPHPDHSLVRAAPAVR